VQVARWQSDVLCSRAAQMVSVVKIQEIAISNYIPHPANVVAVALSPLRTDAGSSSYYNEIDVRCQTVGLFNTGFSNPVWDVYFAVQVTSDFLLEYLNSASYGIDGLSR